MKKELWLRLRNYRFDHVVPDHLMDRVAAVFGGSDASTRAFASKVARKLGWTNRFALRAVEEYKKFVYLGISSGTNVTPPKVIDQVWHEHLLFTRAYRDFCRDVLRKEFDHNPELLATDAQTDVYHEQYAATLALYRAEFNVKPPADIWGTPKFKPGKSRTEYDSSTLPSDSDTPLYLQFSSDSSSGHTMAEFGGGGGFSGGGGEDSWSDSAADSTASDSGSSDSGSCSGGSGCSSSCGGGE
ncbi:MAG: hypothetical protein V4550_10040 [Gemmatimonadota bacterium]